MFKPDNIFSLIATFAVVALATTLVLPGRQTANVITAGANGVSKITSAAIAK